MKTCIKCGDRYKNSEVSVWEEGPQRTYICNECKAVEDDFYEENEDDMSEPHLLPQINRYRVRATRYIRQTVDIFVAGETKCDAELLAIKMLSCNALHENANVKIRKELPIDISKYHGQVLRIKTTQVE